jgi:transposase-like protein
VVAVWYPQSRVRRSSASGFPPEIIVLALRWHLRYGMSYRDGEELLGERGIEVDHVSVAARRGAFAELARTI